MAQTWESPACQANDKGRDVHSKEELRKLADESWRSEIGFRIEVLICSPLLYPPDDPGRMRILRRN